MTTSNWDNLPTDQKAAFYAKADPDSDLTGEDWFNHLVPEEIQGNPEHVEVFMNGGTVTTEEWTYDQGRGSGHYEAIETELPDRDISRVESGSNGGEYTPDNTIMEDASINRARNQGQDITDVEYADAVESNESAVDVLTESFDTNVVEIADTATDATGSLLGDIGGAVVDGLVPALAAFKVGTYIADQCDNDTDKLGYGFAGAGTTVLAFCNPVTGPLCWTGAGIYGAFKLCQLGGKLIQRFA